MIAIIAISCLQSSARDVGRLSIAGRGAAGNSSGLHRRSVTAYLLPSVSFAIAAPFLASTIYMNEHEPLL
jgi:hypothetical protein